MRNYYSEFKDLHPLDLHGIFGINCIQRAMGYDPVIVAMPGKVFGPAVHYLKMLPGGHHPLSMPSDFQSYKDEIIQRLEEEDFILSSAIRSKSYREGALFFSPPTRSVGPDFHVVYKTPDGKYRDKLIFGEDQSYDELPQTIGKYQLFSPLNIPCGATPKFAQVNGVVLETAEYKGKTQDFLIIPPQKFNPLIGHNKIHYDTETKTALLESGCSYTSLPFPRISDFLTPGVPKPAPVVYDSYEL